MHQRPVANILIPPGCAMRHLVIAHFNTLKYVFQ